MELIDRRKLVSDFWQGVEDCAILSYEDTDELMENAPTVKAVPVDEILRVIAGHSNYHGDNILSALICIAEGKKVNPVRPLEKVDAVEASRLGNLGRLMMPYIGCPRGRMGARGDGRIIELDPIKDVEGDIWVPVLEEDLNFLKAKAVEVVRCKDCKHYWKNVNTPGFDGKCTTVGDDDFCSSGERKDNERNAD